MTMLDKAAEITDLCQRLERAAESFNVTSFDLAQRGARITVKVTPIAWNKGPIEVLSFAIALPEEIRP